MEAPKFLTKSITFVRDLLSEPDGTASSTRTLMYIFSFFSIWVIKKVVIHILAVTDAAILSIWLANLPLIMTALMGLIVLPYTVNKGSGLLNDVASMMTASRSGKTDIALSGSFSQLLKKDTGEGTSNTKG